MAALTVTLHFVEMYPESVSPLDPRLTLQPEVQQDGKKRNDEIATWVGPAAYPPAAGLYHMYQINA